MPTCSKRELLIEVPYTRKHVCVTVHCMIIHVPRKGYADLNLHASVYIIVPYFVHLVADLLKCCVISNCAWLRALVQTAAAWHFGSCARLEPSQHEEDEVAMTRERIKSQTCQRSVWRHEADLKNGGNDFT